MAIIIPIIADARGLIAGTAVAEKSLTRLGRNTQKIGRNLTRSVTLPLAVLGAAAVKGFADFDKAITESTAIMGDVSEEMRDRMSNAARDVARQYGISHKEAAQSFFFLASAGLDAEQSIAALPQVAAFAKAGMFDMSTATDLATDAQSALGLTSKNAAENLAGLSRVTDVFVAANTLANASVEQFSSAVTNKAGVAMRNFGIPLEEGTAVLALFADQGIKGAQAGTLLARTLQGLESQSRKNAEQFKAAGISVFDAQGNFRNLGDITEDLTKATKGMTVEQKSALIAQLGFNKQAQQGILALLGNEDAVRKYEDGLRQASGFTQTVAAKQLETFSEQVNLMKAELLDVGIDVAPIILNDFLIPLVDNVKRVVAAFKSLSPETQKLITRGLMLAAALGPVLIIVGKIITLTGTLIGVFKALRVAMIGLNLAFMMSPIGLIVIGIAALAAGLFIAYQRSETFRRIVDQLAATLRSALGVAVEFVKRKLDEWGPAIRSAWSAIRPVLALIGRLIVESIVVRVRLAVAIIRTLITAFREVWKVIGPIVIRIGEGIAQYIVANVRAVIRVVEITIDVFNRLRDTVISVVDRISGPIDRVRGLVERIPGVGRSGRAGRPAGGFFFQFSKDAQKNIRDAIATATQEARKNLISLGSQLGGLVSELIGARSPEAAEAKAIRDRLKREERAREEARLREAISTAETVEDRIQAQRELDD
jgi:TP901 family phage tail tape measure protein